MKAAVFLEKGQMAVADMPMPQLKASGDALIKIVRACVCGSDLWWYRGISHKEANTCAGHEAIGIVQEIGTEVTNIKVGDFVVVPFTHGCGHCAACQAGFDGSCQNPVVADYGYQGEYLRYSNADWALIKVPGQPSDYSEEVLKSLLTLSDVMATGYHAAKTAEVKAGDTVAVVGDGAVGLCAVISAKMLGAERIIMMSRYPDRQALATEFGATDIVAERGQGAVDKIMEMTNQAGVDAVLECVGTDQSTQTAIDICRPGAIIGRVGIPHLEKVDFNSLMWSNVGLRGGIASVTTYVKEVLLEAVLTGQINPGKVFTKTFSLDQIQEAYQAMDQRQAIKSYLIVGD